MNQVTALRDGLRDADNANPDGFPQVFNAFFDVTGLVDASRPSKDKGMRSLVEIVARRHTNDPTLGVTGLLMLHYTPAGLFHGSFRAGTRPGTFFYFVQEQQGIVALCEYPTTHFYRITATLLPPGTVIGRKGVGMN